MVAAAGCGGGCWLCLRLLVVVETDGCDSGCCLWWRLVVVVDAAGCGIVVIHGSGY